MTMTNRRHHAGQCIPSHKKANKQVQPTMNQGLRTHTVLLSRISVDMLHE